MWLGIRTTFGVEWLREMTWLRMGCTWVAGTLRWVLWLLSVGVAIGRLLSVRLRRSSLWRRSLRPRTRHGL